MNPLMWVVFGFMTAGALLAGVAFRRVIEIEFTQFHDEWLKDGKPVGGAGSRRAASFWHSDFATSQVAFDWLFKSPSWTERSPDAQRLLARFRWLMAFFMLGMLVLLAIGFST
jgi:hypothetical protein